MLISGCCHSCSTLTHVRMASVSPRPPTVQKCTNVPNKSSDDITWSPRGRNQAVELVSRFSLFFADGTKFQVPPVTLATACTACSGCLRVNQSISNIPYGSPCVHVCVCGCVSALVVHVITVVFAMYARFGSRLNTVVPITLHDMASPHSGQTRHRSLLVLLLCKTENFPWPSCSRGVFVIKPNQALGSFNS